MKCYDYRVRCAFQGPVRGGFTGLKNVNAISSEFLLTYYFGDYILVQSSLNTIFGYISKGLFRHAILEALQGMPEKLRKINLSNGCGFLIDKYDEIIKYLFVLDSEQLTGAKIPQVLFL